MKYPRPGGGMEEGVVLVGEEELVPVGVGEGV